MTNIFKNFAEENTCDTYADTHDYLEPEPEPEPEREVKQGKRIFTIAMRKVNNKYTQEVVGVRMA